MSSNFTPFHFSYAYPTCQYSYSSIPRTMNELTSSIIPSNTPASASTPSLFLTFATTCACRPRFASSSYTAHRTHSSISTLIPTHSANDDDAPVLAGRGAGHVLRLRGARSARVSLLWVVGSPAIHPCRRVRRGVCARVLLLRLRAGYRCSRGTRTRLLSRRSVSALRRRVSREFKVMVRGRGRG